MPEPITLEFLTRYFDRLTTEVGSLRDDVQVDTAIVLRLNNTCEHYGALLTDMLAELRAIHQQIARMNDRIRKLEDSP